MNSTGTIPILVGMLLITIAIAYRFVALIITIFKNSKCTLRTTATIIKIDEKIVSHKSFKEIRKTTVYTPIFQYMIDGVTYKFKGKSKDINFKKVGDQENIFCDPIHPSVNIHEVDNMSYLLIRFMILLLIGLCCILYAIILNLI